MKFLRSFPIHPPLLERESSCTKLKIMISKMNILSSQECKIHSFPFEVLYFKLKIEIHEYRKESSEHPHGETLP